MLFPMHSCVHNLYKKVACVGYVSSKHGVVLLQMSDKKGYQGTGTKADLGNHANQCNPNHSECKGHTSKYQGSGGQPDRDNHANQGNPNNSSYTAPKK